MLHLVPAPLNGEYLAEIAINTVFLFFAIHVFSVNMRRPLFPAMAVLSSVLFLLCSRDQLLPASAMVSLWLPYMALFCFLLLVASCASFAAGNWNHVPLVALSGMIMIHAHVAQLLFVTVLSLAAAGTAIFQEWKRRTLKQTLRAYKYSVVTAFGIVVLFLFPIAIDFKIHHPNNIHEIRAYLREHRGEHNSGLKTLLYTTSFFTYDAYPETALANPRPRIGDLLNDKPFVRLYWVIFLAVSTGAVASYLIRKQKLSFFLKFAITEIGLILVLFLYWSWRITGPMFGFNGYFFFSVQLLALLVCCSLLSANISTRLKWRWQVALAGASAIPLLFVAGLTNVDAGDPEVLAIVSSLRESQAKNFELIIQRPEQWPIVAGVASYLTRAGAYFCVEREWTFMFGAAHKCRNTDAYYRVVFTDKPTICESPCAVKYDRPNLYITGSPVSSHLKPRDVGKTHHRAQGPSDFNVLG